MPTLEDVTKELKADDYFAHDELHVFAVPSVAALNDVGHGVHMTRKGVSGKTPQPALLFRYVYQ